jgi:hypothetical protein
MHSCRGALTSKRDTTYNSETVGAMKLHLFPQKDLEYVYIRTSASCSHESNEC